MNRVILLLLVAVTCGCRTTRTATIPESPQLRVLTYNVNWGGARPDLAAEIIRRSGAEIVCLQETTPQWAAYLRQSVGREYPFMEFRDSAQRMGGGLAFLAKRAGAEVAYVPSGTGWFDGWIMGFETELGPVQVINVHLRPPISDSGSWVSGYFTTGDERRRELERFYRARDPQTPTLVLGDFNDGEDSAVVEWLEAQGMKNALPQFNRYQPTWQWKTSLLTLKRRMDHVFYSPQFDCANAQVTPAGASDHFPVEAILVRAK
jgi:endonuclease/exonuclease/phosphatase family metal-dependent hydrolase